VRRAYRVLLRVTPSIPCTLDRAFDQLEPVLVRHPIGRRRQSEQLPQSLLAHDHDHRLPTRPAGVPIGPRVLRVRRHQSLLDGENEVVRRVQGCGRQWRVGPAQADLQRADGFAKVLRRLDVVVEPQPLDIVQERIGLCHQRSTLVFDFIAD
jgi:hypothetical protein